MYDDDADIVAREISTLSKGQLYCLPYTRTLLDYYDQLGVVARPLVVRAVVFSLNAGCTWNDLLKNLPPSHLVKQVIGSPHANGDIELAIDAKTPGKSRDIRLSYRTLGYSHGMAKMGSFESDGRWNGHLVVVADIAMIDMTIGQLNSERFGIHFESPHIIIEIPKGFLSEQQLLVSIVNNMMVCYQTYPDERTYEESCSWNDPNFRNQLRCVAELAAQTSPRRQKMNE